MKAKKKILLIIIIIVAAFLFIPSIITIVTNSDLEKIKEEKDLANLNEAYATAVLMMAEDKNSFSNKPMWYNPQTGQFMYKKVISGKGTDKKDENTDYSTEEFTRFNYDGSSTISKGIKLTFISKQSDDDPEIHVEFSSIRFTKKL